MGVLDKMSVVVILSSPKSTSSIFGIYLGDRDVIKTNDQGKALQNLRDCPSTIDYDLEAAVTQWESSINAYREFELSIIQDSKVSFIALSILDELRDTPEKYFTHENASIAKLAAMRGIFISTKTT